MSAESGKARPTNMTNREVGKAEFAELAGDTLHIDLWRGCSGVSSGGDTGAALPDTSRPW